MAVVAIWRWVLLGLLKSPATWAIWLLLVGIPLLQTLAFPASSWGVLEAAKAWSFPAGLAGGGLSLVLLANGRAFLGRFPARARFAGELGGVMLAAMYLQLPLLAGLLVASGGLRDPWLALPAILTADLHLAGLALLVSTTSLSPPLCASVFLAAAWLIPALSSGTAALARTSVLLDSAAPLRAGTDGLPSALLPAASLALAAYLLRTRPTPSPPG